MVTELEEFKIEQEGKRKERGILRKAKEGIEKEITLKKEIRGKKIKAIKEKIEKGTRKEFTSLQKALVKGAKQRRKEALQSKIARERLLHAIVSRQREGRPVNIMRKITDKIPEVFTISREKKEKPTFFSRGGLI